MLRQNLNILAVPIDDLVPHRRPMRLIDEILEVDEDSALSAAVVLPTWPLVFDNAVNPIVLIELVAQTSAAFGGYQKKKEGSTVGGGMIVAVKSATFYLERVPVNSQLITRSCTRVLIENFKEVSGVVNLGGAVIGEVTLQSISSQ